MINSKRILMSIAACVLIIGIGHGQDKDWKLTLEKDSIKVYTRPAPGCPLDQFMGVTEVETSVKTIEKLLRDVDAQPQWMGDCLAARTLKTIDGNRLVCYNVLHVDWPLTNRDLLIDVTFITDPAGKKLTVEMKAYPDDIIPIDPKLVRIRDFRATCIAEEIAPGRCKVTYINRVNPMAPVPDFLANSIVRKNPYTTLKGMKRMVTLTKYAASI